MSDDLSGDMLAPSWPNLVFINIIIITLTIKAWLAKVTPRLDHNHGFPTQTMVFNGVKPWLIVLNFGRHRQQ